MELKIMLADDHTLVRKGIRLLLESEGDIRVVGEAGNGIECMEKLERFRSTDAMPHILLLDIFMPGKNGIEVLSEIKKSMAELKVIILTAHGEKCVQAIERGAAGYLLKSVEVSELRNALCHVMAGEKYIQSECIQPRLNFEISNEISNIKVENNFIYNKNKINKLTKREKEILRQITEGMLNKEIADYFSISERTVKNHISSIFRKLEVSDRTQAAVYALQHFKFF